MKPVAPLGNKRVALCLFTFMQMEATGREGLLAYWISLRKPWVSIEEVRYSNNVESPQDIVEGLRSKGQINLVWYKRDGV